LIKNENLEKKKKNQKKFKKKDKKNEIKIDDENLKLLGKYKYEDEIIGKGGFGKVYKGIDENYNLIAIKVIDLVKNKKQEYLSLIKNEINIMKEMQKNNKYLVKYLLRNGLDKIEYIQGTLKMISSLKGDLKNSKQHKNSVTLGELKNKYYDSKSNLDTKTQLLMGAKKDLIDLNLECLNTQDLITKSINKLQQIALNKSVFESSEEHIDLLIENEKTEHKEGWKIRIEGLELLKQQKKLLREIYNGENQNLCNMKKFIEDSLNKEKNLNNIDSDCCIF